MSSASIVATLRDRLVLQHAEITGINNSIEEFLHFPVAAGDPPFVTHGWVSTDVVSNSSSIYTATVTMLATVYVAVLEQDLDATDGSGSEALALVTTMHDRFIDYHIQNPRLATSSLAALKQVSHPVRLQARIARLFDGSQVEYIGFHLQIVVDYETFRKTGI